MLLNKLYQEKTVLCVGIIHIPNENVKDHATSLSHLIKRLRKKLPEVLIENIYGEGYKIHSFR